MEKSKDLAIVLVSGGMDSCLSAAIANENHEDLAFLHLNYGQNTEKKELECYHAICDHYGVEHHNRKIIDVSFLQQIGGSSLTDRNIDVKKYQGDSEEIPDSYVPFRNTHIISMAFFGRSYWGEKNIYRRCRRR